MLKVDDDTFVNLPNLIHVLLGGTVPLYNASISFHDRESIIVKAAKNRLTNTKNLLLGHLFCGESLLFRLFYVRTLSNPDVILTRRRETSS